jgi:hypothetical protein
VLTKTVKYRGLQMALNLDFHHKLGQYDESTEAMLEREAKYLVDPENGYIAPAPGEAESRWHAANTEPDIRLTFPSISIHKRKRVQAWDYNSKQWTNQNVWNTDYDKFSVTAVYSIENLMNQLAVAHKTYLIKVAEAGKITAKKNQEEAEQQKAEEAKRKAEAAKAKKKAAKKIKA